MSINSYDTIYIYRSCDRPKYVKETLAHNVARISDRTLTVVYDNSTDPEAAEKLIRQEMSGVVDDWVFLQSDKPRIGGVNVIIKAIERMQESPYDFDYVLVGDDDCRFPEGWDTALLEMMEAGWDIVAHPWSNDFRDPKNLTEVGGVKGYPFAHVNGGCSGFSIDLWRKSIRMGAPLNQISKIRGYNAWMMKMRRKSNLDVGYSGEDDLLFEHIDRPEHPLSLRDTEYCEWSDEMYYERFPKHKRAGKKRPKGQAGAW